METTTLIKKTLTIATFDVFEKMFYIFLEMASLGDQQRCDMVASLRFSGPLEGEIRLYLPGALAGAMAENMLSVHPSQVTKAMREDCAREAVNMIGGEFLRTLDPTRVFNLSVPLCYTNIPPVSAGSPRADCVESVHFESDRGYLFISAALKASGKAHRPEHDE
jgi:hypothetical protein